MYAAVNLLQKFLIALFFIGFLEKSTSIKRFLGEFNLQGTDLHDKGNFERT
ncbi:hypothetical protein BSG1_17790 [Bacillus sp. SG-1]|nr:hypothetical protein BSG1_17790 [Bacillus sp. SG-1]